MLTNSSYKFGPFLLNPADYSLSRGGERIPLERKAMEVLVVLVKNHGRLVKKERLIDEVWGVGYSMTPSNLNRRITEIREALDKDDPANPRYIKTETRLGYRFIAQVEEQHDESARAAEAQHPPESSPTTAQHAAVDVVEQEIPARGEKRRAVWWSRKKIAIVCVIMLFAFASVALIWRWRAAETPAGGRRQVRSLSDEAEVMRVVKESQIYETLGIYTHPETFDRNQLDKFWMSVAQGGKAIPAIEAAVGRLRQKGWRYADESRLEIFDFRYVRIFSPRDYAEAGTSERWYVPTVWADGSRVRDRNVYLGVYDVDYTLRKINGRWLIEENSTPRFGTNTNQNN